MSTRFTERDMRIIKRAYDHGNECLLELVQSAYGKENISQRTLNRMIKSGFNLDRYKEMCYEESGKAVKKEGVRDKVDVVFVQKVEEESCLMMSMKAFCCAFIGAMIVRMIIEIFWK